MPALSIYQTSAWVQTYALNYSYDFSHIADAIPLEPAAQFEVIENKPVDFYLALDVNQCDLITYIAPFLKFRALFADDGGGWKAAGWGRLDTSTSFSILPWMAALLALWFLNFVEAGDVQARLSFQSPSTLASSCLSFG